MSDSSEAAYLNAMNMDLRQANERNLETIEDLRIQIARQDAELVELRDIIAVAALYVRHAAGDLNHLDDSDLLATVTAKIERYVIGKVAHS